MLAACTKSFAVAQAWEPSGRKSSKIKRLVKMPEFFPARISLSLSPISTDFDKSISYFLAAEIIIPVFGFLQLHDCAYFLMDPEK